MMHLAIFGGNGWIGTQFCEGLDRAGVKYTHAPCRADDDVAVKEFLKNYGFTHCVSLIGRTSGVYNGTPITTIDYLEKPGKLVENVRDNLFSPVLLALICREFGIHYTYLGTGCIFDGYPGENGYTEDAVPDFFGSSYSTVKGFTDRLMHQLKDTVLNLRIRMPISDRSNPRDFITKITNYSRICSIPNSMTVIPDFIPVWIDLISKNATGTVNCTNPGVISHNEILEMYREIVDPRFTWVNFSLEEQAQILLSARSNNQLDATGLAKRGYTIEPIGPSIRRILEGRRSC